MTVNDLIDALNDFDGDAKVHLGEAGLYIEGSILMVPELAD